MRKSEKWDRLDPADLEQMSTAGLEKLLLQDFQDPESGEERMDRLYYAAQLLAEQDPISNAAANQAWERFQEQYLPFAEARSTHHADGAAPSAYAAQGRRRSSLRRWGVRGILVAAALAIFLLSISAAAAAAGHGLWRMLAQWTDEIIHLAPGQIVRADRDEIRIPEEGTGYASLQDALDDCGLAQPVAPRWLPDGFTQVDLGVDTGISDSLIFHAAYQRDEDAIVILIDVFLTRQDGSHGTYGNFQKDEGDPIPYEAGGITHLLSTNAGRPIALWSNGPAEGAISGDITMEELKQIIDSIYE